jgi:cytochrome oxidase Cu insertion factor (SCO1/SenC/PrrC family)
MIYNAPRFKVKQYDWDVFAGPAAGEPVKDYTFSDLDGNEVKLSDYRGKWIVLETGSATCSMYSKNIPDMKDVIKEFPDVEFLLIYVREAHPGERLHQHRSMEEKIEAAKMLQPRYGEDRKILVDTLDGKYHLAHAAMPNTMYIIRPDGTVHYRCNWTTVDGVREALLDRENFHTQENADVKSLKAARGLYTSLRTMWTGGFVALWDFVKAGPQLAKRHKLVDDYYQEHGKFKQVPGK